MTFREVHGDISALQRVTRYSRQYQTPQRYFFKIPITVSTVRKSQFDFLIEKRANPYVSVKIPNKKKVDDSLLPANKKAATIEKTDVTDPTEFDHFIENGNLNYPRSDGKFKVLLNSLFERREKLFICALSLLMVFVALLLVILSLDLNCDSYESITDNYSSNGLKVGMLRYN